MGLESTPDEFIEKMTDVFRKVKRVLRNDGTLIFNDLIRDFWGDEYHIKEDTVGQFTGMTDKEGNKIFEGDIIENADGDLRQIVYSENSFLMNLMDGRKCNFSWYYSCKVVGNIHQNPELLKEK